MKLTADLVPSIEPPLNDPILFKSNTISITIPDCPRTARTRQIHQEQVWKKVPNPWMSRFRDSTSSPNQNDILSRPTSIKLLAEKVSLATSILLTATGSKISEDNATVFVHVLRRHLIGPRQDGQTKSHLSVGPPYSFHTLLCAYSHQGTILEILKSTLRNA